MTCIVAGAMLLCGCVGPSMHLPTISHFDTRRVAVVIIDTAVARYTIATYLRADSANLEDALCYYGQVEQRDSVFVLVIDRASLPDTVFGRDQHWVSAQCDKSSGYVGRFHTHLSDNGKPPMPGLSPIDEISFYNDTRALITFVGVGFGIVSGDTLLVTAYEFQDRRRGYVMLRAH